MCPQRFVNYTFLLVISELMSSIKRGKQTVKNMQKLKIVKSCKTELGFVCHADVYELQPIEKFHEI